MEIAVSHLRCSTVRETFTLHHLTDLHIDDSDHAPEVLARRIEAIREDPNALWVGGGDYGSLILPGDRRYSTSRFDPHHRLPDRYVESLVEMFDPIKEKCVGLATGNHEWTIGKHYHRGVVPEVAKQLGIASMYLGARGWYVLCFHLHSRQITLRGYQFHGWSAGRLKGRKAIQAERDLGAWDADIFTLGHDHQPYADVWYTEECRFAGRENGYVLSQRPRAVINGGACVLTKPPLRDKDTLKLSEFPNDSWVEGKNFRPQPPVSPTLRIEIDFGTRTRPSGYGFRVEIDAPVF